MPRYGSRHPKNQTRYASLDRIAADPRIERIWDEGPNGIWADLAPGYNVEGIGSLHGNVPFSDIRPGEERRSALQNFLLEYKLIEKGDPY